MNSCRLAEPRRARHVGLGVHPVERVHHERLDLALGRIRPAGDPELGDPYGLAEARVGGLDIFLEACQVVPRSVPGHAIVEYSIKSEEKNAGKRTSGDI